MADIKYFAGIDLQNNELKNAVVHALASAPSSPSEGQIYYNTADDKLYVYNGSTWDEIGSSALTVAAGSQNFLTIADGEISFENLAITGVTVDVTATDIANFVSSNYTVGNEFQEGDVIIMTAATDQAARSYIHNGGTAVSSADFTRLQADISAADIRAEVSAGDGLTYTQGTGVFEADVDDSTIQVGVSGLEIKDSGVSTPKIANDAVDKDKIAADVAGNGLAQNVDGSLEVNVDDSTIELSTDTVQVKDAGITETKLASAVTAQLRKVYKETIGDGVTIVHTITHGLGTKDIMTQIYDISTGACIECDVVRNTTNSIQVTANPAFTTDNVRVMIIEI